MKYAANMSFGVVGAWPLSTGVAEVTQRMRLSLNENARRGRMQVARPARAGARLSIIRYIRGLSMVPAKTIMLRSRKDGNEDSRSASCAAQGTEPKDRTK